MYNYMVTTILTMLPYPAKGDNMFEKAASGCDLYTL